MKTGAELNMPTQGDKPLTDTFKPIYVNFIFPERQQAFGFAELITERNWTARVMYSPERASWQTTVRREIHPVFRDVTIWLAALTVRATPLGGEKDGWGYERPTSSSY